jgi:aspartate kinase
MDKLIESVEYNTKVAKVTLCKVPDRYGVAAEIFGALGQHGINVELISTTTAGRSRADVSFAILESDLNAVMKLLEAIKDKFGAEEIAVNKDCALVTVYGSNLSATPGVAGKIFAKLSERGVNIEMISTSISTLSIVLNKDKAMEIVGAIRTEFSI